ncbi:MAG: glycosyltransferase [Nitrospiraceae bacterium]
MTPSVSIILCSKDRPDDLTRAIASIRSCDEVGRQAELVVVEECSQARAIPGVRYVHLPPLGLGFGHARNTGLMAAGGDILLFIDDDCRAVPGWASALVRHFSSDPSVLGVAGAVLVKDCGLIGHAEHILGFPGGGLRTVHEARGRVIPTRHLSTCNCAYRRTTLEQIGGFPEGTTWGGEDALVAERISAMGPCLFAPDAQVYHRTRDGLGQIFLWFVRRGRSDVATIRYRTDRRRYVTGLLRHSWALKAIPIAGFMAVVPNPISLLSLMILIYYGVLLRRYRFARQYHTHRKALWLVPIVKLVMDLGADVGRMMASFAKASTGTTRSSDPETTTSP